MSLKIALVGCGKIADGHIEEIQKMSGKATVVAVCDREPLMAEQIAVRYGIAGRYDDFARLLTEVRPDVVHITTPPQSHLALAKMAIDAGCHVYVEKPLTLDYPTAKELIDYAVAAGKKLTIGYSYYFDPPALTMRSLIEKGVLGEIVHIESFYGYNLSGPFGAAILGDGSHWVHHLPGKLFHNNIDHLLCKVSEFLDEDTPCLRATGFVRRTGRYEDSRDAMQDELRVTIQGQNLTAYATFSSHIRPAANFARIYGTRNTLHLDYGNRTATLATTPKLPGAIGRLLPPFQDAWQSFREGRRNLKQFFRSDFHYFRGLNHLISLFYDCILHDTAPPISYREILRTSAMMDEIFRQIDQEEIRP